MLNEIKEKVKTLKWYNFIPVIGSILYTYGCDKIINEAETKLRSNVKLYKSIYDFVGIIFAAIIIGLTFGLDWSFKPGGMPVVFWVGVAWGIMNNITPFIPFTWYSLGIKRYEKKNNL